MASFGWINSWLSASARKYPRSFSTSAAFSTPRTLRMESMRRRFCSSPGRGSSNLCTLASTRKFASWQSSSSILFICSFSSCAVAKLGSPPSPSPPPPVAPMLEPTVASCELESLKMVSEGGYQCKPNCCSCSTLSACKTCRMVVVMSPSFMFHSSRYLRVSASSKCTNLVCNSLNCSVSLLNSSVSSALSDLNFRSSRAYLPLSPESTSCSRAILRFCC
mmetsp:Transcript_17143/g.39622  ORF Transcript_17143/g.39622 Transcript_17143/m.39622 type:complete len:220 (-) Transcript_17143:942-1601(-)